MATKAKAKASKKDVLAVLSGARSMPAPTKTAKPEPAKPVKSEPIKLRSFHAEQAKGTPPKAAKAPPAIPIPAPTPSAASVAAPGLPEAVSTEVAMPRPPQGHSFTEPMLMLFQDIDRWYHCVVWEERDEKNKPVRLHLARRADNGQVIHEHRPPHEVAFLRETSAKTLPKQFLQYLKGKLTEVGGNSSAYDKLGVPKPVIVMEARPETAREHDELYERAARLLEIPEEELRRKYGHLNPGLQAMNLRNRLRGKGYEV